MPRRQAITLSVQAWLALLIMDKTLWTAWIEKTLGERKGPESYRSSATVSIAELGARWRMWIAVVICDAMDRA